MVNSFYTFMLAVAAIVLFVLSNDDSGAIASGIFLLFAGACYGADCYYALLNMGAFDRPGEDGGATHPTPYPPPPVVPEQRSQPFTPPPTYNPPPALAGQGPYTVPQSGGIQNTTGDLGQRM